MIVIDCGAIVDALTGAPGAEEVRERVRAEELHAPHLLDYEVVSAVRGLTLGGHLSEPRALDALADFDELPVFRWVASDGLRRRALGLRHNLSAYDAAYVALAEALECPLLTRDRRVAKAVGNDVRVEVV
jgi:predicted nucleic acid-binding protein